MSEATDTMVPMKELERQIRMGRKSLAMAEEFEKESGYDIDATMDRKWNEGFLEALEFIYILQNGYGYDENND